MRKASKPKPPVRDPNVPVLAFSVGTTLFEILIAGKGEYITCAYNPKHKWSDNSLIVREWRVGGLRETEYDLYDPGTWGWFGRLMANPESEAIKIALHTPTDSQLIRGKGVPFVYVRPQPGDTTPLTFPPAT